MIAPLLGLPRQSEVLIIIFLGICFLSFDFSLFEIKSNLEQVWKIELNKTKQIESLIKYVICAVVLVRTFTLHVFLAFYFIMLWPAIFEEKPNLMLPWLFLGIIRCLVLNVITFVVGTFICQKEKGLSAICLDFVVSQIIEHGPSVYAWMSVLSFYRELVDEHRPSEESLLSRKEETVNTDGINGDSSEKSKCYSLSDLNLDFMHSSRFRNLSGNMPIEELLEELKHVVSKSRLVSDSSKSFDSLKPDGSENLDEFDALKESDLTFIEKSMKILNISREDVETAQKEKNKLIEILKEVRTEDVKRIEQSPSVNMTSPSFYIKRGTIHKGNKSLVQRSISLHEEQKSRKTCLCYLRRKLQEEQSKLTLEESEIANIEFDRDVEQLTNEETLEEIEKSECKAAKTVWKKTCQSGKHDDIKINKILSDLNSCGVVVGTRLTPHTDMFLCKFLMKKNTSRNFGCQVSLLRGGFLSSGNELVKKLELLRNFGIL